MSTKRRTETNPPLLYFRGGRDWHTTHKIRDYQKVFVDNYQSRVVIYHICIIVSLYGLFINKIQMSIIKNNIQRLD